MDLKSTGARVILAVAAGVVMVAVLAVLFLGDGATEEDDSGDSSPSAASTATTPAGTTPGSDPTGTATPTPSAAVDIDEALRIEVDEGLLSDLETAIGTLPDGDGATDRDQIESMLGTPDAFVVAYEVVGGEDETSGEVVRYETWVYYELASGFEFADGMLVANLPVQEVTGPTLLPGSYEPHRFQRETTWTDVQQMVTHADSAAMTEVPAELLQGTGSTLTVYAVDQLLVAFDQDGLVYAETIPLEP